MQRSWPPDHFLIQTLIAFLNAPAHTANAPFAVAESHLALGKLYGGEVVATSFIVFLGILMSYF